ncbi:hypothetical protein FRX31_004621 [Thalictrum thalictroides]|uniref:Uncharacterized protein n=1 Tax=Thalictrum thalictroides TaxID=46969 RepID=A0A7J6XBG6_THATH|nr:hypothetical protein FRX31_004621 [Thalictrum thalictroides]
MAYPMLEYWKKKFENNMDEVSLCDVIKRAIYVASVYYPDELRKRRDVILEDLYDDRSKYEICNEEDKYHKLMKKINDCSTDLKEDDKKTMSSTITDHEISGCFDGDKETALNKVKKDGMKINPMVPKISKCCLDEEAIQKKLEVSKRKLHERYEQEVEAKKQRVVKVLKQDELPKKNAFHQPSLYAKRFHKRPVVFRIR